MRLALALIGLAALAQETTPAERRIQRDPSVVRRFRAANPCPFLPGDCIADHVVPLACHTVLRVPVRSLDTVTNLQWQRKADALAKDRWERKHCRELVADRRFQPHRKAWWRIWR